MAASAAGSARDDPRHDLPAQRWSVRDQLRRLVASSQIKLAVVDDDPTGTQTVRDVPLVATFDSSEIEWAMVNAAPTFAILTNARAAVESEAAAINRRLGEELAFASRQLDVPLRVLSRSDSTLRGHFPAEPEALATGLGAGDRSTDAVLVCPAFVEAGRFTVRGTHWVEQGGSAMPVGETEFSRDGVFGYRSSQLSRWIRERAGASSRIASIGIDSLRLGGPDEVCQLLLDARGHARYIVADAVDASDLEVLALAVHRAEEHGMGFVYRTGPSFVAARVGDRSATPLSRSELSVAGGRGLVVVGSHTDLTTRQLEIALEHFALEVVTLDARALLRSRGETRDAIVSGTRDALAKALALGDAAIVTTRDAVSGADGGTGLDVAKTVGDALTAIVRDVAREVRLEWLLAKGGITSHDMAVRALGARRATVLGQVFPGQVSVWELGEGSVQPGIRYVVFPGNVGEDGAMAKTLDLLGARR